MFDPAEFAGALPPSNKPLRSAVRHLHWFRTAFEAHIQVCGDKMGCTLVCDRMTIARVFVRWIKALDTQRPKNRAERRDFFEFAPSLVLRELMADIPVKAEGPALRAEPGSAAQFWPEGYACLMFCLSIHSAAMDQEFHAGVEVGKMVDDLRSWWSLRENAGHDISFAAGFFQKLTGHEPNWHMPDNFQARVRTQS